MDERVNVNIRINGAEQYIRDANKVATATENMGKKAKASGDQFSKATRQFSQGGQDLKKVFNMLSGAAIGAGVGGVGAAAFRSLSALGSLPVFADKAYAGQGQMKGLQAGLLGMGGGGAAGALGGGALGGLLGGAIGSAIAPGIGTAIGGLLGGAGGAALGGIGGGGISAIGAMFAEATAKAEPFMDALLRMSDALKPLMDALITFANTLAPAFDAAYPAILELSEIMAGFVNMIAGPLAGAIQFVGQYYAVVFGIMGDNTHGLVEKILDLFTAMVRGVATILDTVFIPIWNMMLDAIASTTGNVMGGIANSIANGLISAVNWAMTQISNVINSNPLIAMYAGINGWSGWSNIGAVDFSGAFNSAANTVYGSLKMGGGMFNGILDKLGVSSIGDLAGKYGIDLNARGSAQKLVEALKENTTALKDVRDSFTAEVYVNQTFNGTVTRESMRVANEEVYRAIDRAFDARGVGA